MNQNRAQEAESLYALFNEYREAYAPEWARLERCERLYLGDNWYGVPETEKNEPRPHTPILQSTIENIRADLMDSYPEAIIVADDPRYTREARLLSAAVRENHIRCAYQDEYGKLMHDLLVVGYMVQESGFDASLNKGLGGAYLRHADVRGIMFDPCVTNMQDSRAVFKFAPYTREWFSQRYPSKVHNMRADAFQINRLRDGVLYQRDHDSVLLIECWRRVHDPITNSCRVHMQRLAGGVILEDSRTQKPEGYYAHGEYPFTITPLFPRKGCSLGFGLIDMFETEQRYADKLDQIVLKNALMASRNKLLVTGASGFDADDLRDWSKDVHRGENLNGVTWFPTAPLPAYILDHIDRIRNSIREESGANDFSRGMTRGGVTAASAIAALQELSGKRSRMAAREVHAAFEAAVRQEIEVEREYSIFDRFLSEDTTEANAAPVPFNASMLSRDTPLNNRVPLEFRVTVKVQRENRFSVLANNELVMELVKSGMVTPDVGLELMLFDGKEQALSLMRSKRQEMTGEMGMNG
ncbi:MAG TPA: hypothetical protein VN608_00190 [Clostridia bacterium]|nr:hypothetical protein [Clostridia bacterium]